jgi:hypothetical protein
MERSIADDMNSMEWVKMMCGGYSFSVRPLSPLDYQARCEPDDFSEICGECGEDVVDCTCPPNVNEDGGTNDANE